MIVKSHLYRSTVDHMEDPSGNAVEQSPLVFDARSHDDVFKIVDAMKGKMEFDEADTATFAVGLKLFGGVMMKHKDNELFAQFMPHLRDFMKGLKRPTG